MARLVLQTVQKADEQQFRVLLNRAHLQIVRVEKLQPDSVWYIHLIKEPNNWLIIDTFSGTTS